VSELSFNQSSSNTYQKTRLTRNLLLEIALSSSVDALKPQNASICLINSSTTFQAPSLRSFACYDRPLNIMLAYDYQLSTIPKFSVIWQFCPHLSL
jgi:hypothetical protein